MTRPRYRLTISGKAECKFNSRFTTIRSDIQSSETVACKCIEILSLISLYFFTDDSDHYYETLNQSGHAEEGNIVVKAKTQSTALVSGMNRAGDHNHHHKMVGTNEIQDDDYDSFDSDDEAEDENVKKVGNITCVNVWGLTTLAIGAAFACAQLQRSLICNPFHYLIAHCNCRMTAALMLAYQNCQIHQHQLIKCMQLCRKSTRILDRCRKA